MAAGIVGSVLVGLAGKALPSIEEAVSGIIKHYLPDPVAQQQMQLDITKALNERDVLMVQALMQINASQAQVNAVEAQSPSFFKGGWRPAVAWVCVFGFFYNFVIAPLATWALAIIGNGLGIAIPVPPTLDGQSLWTILGGLLGLAGLRSFDISNGTAAPDVPLLPRKK